MDPEEDNPDHLKRFAKFLIFVLIKILVLSSIDFWVSFDMILTHTLDWDQNILNISEAAVKLVSMEHFEKKWFGF